MYSPLSEYVEQVDVAFAGVQVEREGDWDAVLTFEVDRVYKGRIAPRVDVYTSFSSSCGIDFERAGYTGVAAFGEPDSPKLWVHWCGSHVSIEELEEVFGSGYPPDETLAPPATQQISTTAVPVEEPEEPSTVSHPTDETLAPPATQAGSATIWVLGTGSAMAVLVAILIGIRRRRRRTGG